MPRMSLPVEGSGGSARGGVGGTPAGCAGWRRRSDRRVAGGRGAAVSRRGAVAVAVAGASRGESVAAGRAAGAAGRAGVAAGCAAGALRGGAGVLEDPCARRAGARFGTGREPLPSAGPPFSFAGDEEDADRCAGAGAARLSLRRCGRLRGSAPRTSEGRSSLNRPQSWRTALLGARGKSLVAACGNALLAKSEQDLKPPSRLRVYV